MATEWFDDPEYRYPGFRELVASWAAAELPACPRCRSADTARVSDGFTDVSTRLAAATSKIRLLANGHPADFYCNSCGRYFDSWGQTVDVGGLLITVDRPEKWIFSYALFVELQNPGEKSVRWDPRQLHALGHDGEEYAEQDEEDGEAAEAGHDPAGNDTSKPLESVDRAGYLQRRGREQGYLVFSLPEYHYVKRVVYGPVDAPIATWRS